LIPLLLFQKALLSLPLLVHSDIRQNILSS
jgi:hypothetical protein